MKVRLDTNHGAIELTLDAASAPNTVANFAQLRARRTLREYRLSPRDQGFHDSRWWLRTRHESKIHRQSHRERGRQRSDQRTSAASPWRAPRTRIPHRLSSSSTPRTTTSSITPPKTPEGWGYCVFGKVSDGMDVVARIEDAATGVKAGHRDVPNDDVVIQSAEVVEE